MHYSSHGGSACHSSAVGFWSRLLRGDRALPIPAEGGELTLAALEGELFDASTETIPAAFFGLSSYSDPVAIAQRVDRRSAMQVPAVKRVRDIICGTPAMLPIRLTAPDRTPAPWALGEQPEQHTPRSVTIARTLEDMLFEGVAFWLIVGYNWQGYPSRVLRVDPRMVGLSQEGHYFITRQGTTGTVDRWVEDRQIIRFDSANDPLLVAGARAIRTCLTLDAAAARNSDGTPPVDYLTPADGVDAMEDDEVTELLNTWQQARRQRSTAYVPGGLKYETGGWSPEQLQLSEARQHAVLEIARLAGIDGEDVGVSTTSRTYFNAYDRRKMLLDTVLRLYMVPLAERLSMNDITPRGYTAGFDLDEWLRTDPLTRQQVYALALANGAMTLDELRDAEGKPRLTPTERDEQATHAARRPATVTTGDHSNA